MEMAHHELRIIIMLEMESKCMSWESHCNYAQNYYVALGIIIMPIIWTQ